jgi:hypothetical protein
MHHRASGHQASGHQASGHQASGHQASGLGEIGARPHPLDAKEF